MKLIVDTSILIDKLRGGDKWDRFLDGLDRSVRLYLPSIVVFELFSGLSSKKAQISLQISNFRKFFSEVDLTAEIAMRAGEIHRDLSFDLDLPDYIIAASAIQIGAKIVTLNKKHFQKIPGVSLYEIN